MPSDLEDVRQQILRIETEIGEIIRQRDLLLRLGQTKSAEDAFNLYKDQHNDNDTSLRSALHALMLMVDSLAPDRLHLRAVVERCDRDLLTRLFSRMSDAQPLYRKLDADQVT